MPDNPNTASPTRCAEVERALNGLRLTTGVKPIGYMVGTNDGPALLAYIAQLEAQPKPQSDEGLRITLEQIVERCVFSQKNGDDLGRQNTISFILRDALAALSRQAPVPTQSNEDLAVRIAELARNMRDKPYEDLAAAIEPMLVIRAPVPTSGAVEWADKAEASLGKRRSANALVKALAPFFQQAMDGAAAKLTADIKQMRNDAALKASAIGLTLGYESDDWPSHNGLLKHIAALRDAPAEALRHFKMGNVTGAVNTLERALVGKAAIATKTPAADGKLREALEHLFVAAENMEEHYIKLFEDRFPGEDNDTACEFEMQLAHTKDILSALAQPASGGGE